MSSLEYEPKPVRVVEAKEGKEFRFETKGDGISEIKVDRPRETKGEGLRETKGELPREEDELEKYRKQIKDIKAYYEIGPATQAYNTSRMQDNRLAEKEREEGMSVLKMAGWTVLVFVIVLAIIAIGLWLGGYFDASSECGKRNHNGTCAPGTICARGNDGEYECLRRCALAFPCAEGFICEFSDGKQVCLPL